MDKFSFESFVRLRAKPLPFHKAFINLIPDDILGVYILFNGKEPNKNSIVYVGRSDKNLKLRLLNHNHKTEVTHFCFYPCGNPTHAYLFEKRLYTRFLPVLNRVFPAYPHESLTEIESTFLNFIKLQ